MIFSRWLLPRIDAAANDPAARAQLGLTAGWASVSINLALTVLKGAVAILTGSVSLVADALHSLSDLFTTIVVMAGFRIARRPPDRRHPFGHGRMESISALIVGTVLAVIAVEMCRVGVTRLLKPEALEVEAWMLVLLFVTLVIKELLARFSKEIGDAIDSDSLRADAMHQRSDALGTVLVIAAFFGARAGVLWLDGAMAICVAALIAWAAVQTLRRAVSFLLGEQAPPAMIEEIEALARSMPDVQGVHGIIVQRYGSMNVICVDIEVPLDDPLRLHAISQGLEARIVRRFPGYVVIHVDPINTTHPHYAEAERIVSEALAEVDDIANHHDLRILGGEERFKVAFDVVPTGSLSDARVTAIRVHVLSRLRRRFPEAGIVMEADSPFFGSLGSSES